MSKGKSEFIELVDRLVAAERRSADADRRAFEMEQLINDHHYVDETKALPANCPACGKVLVRRFR